MKFVPPPLNRPNSSPNLSEKREKAFRCANAWEQRKLSDGMTEYTDRVFIEDDQIYKQVTVKNTGEISLRGSQPGRNIGRKRQARVNLRDYPMTLIFTRQTVEQGGIGFAKNDVDGCIVTENMPTIAVDGKKFNQDFLVAFFKTYGFRKDVILSNIEGGTAQIAIHEDDILDSSSTFPSLKEQIKIGNFFRTLSQQITLHQRKWVEFFYPTYFRKFSFLNFWEFFNNRITNAWEQRKLSDLCSAQCTPVLAGRISAHLNFSIKVNTYSLLVQILIMAVSVLIPAISLKKKDMIRIRIFRSKMEAFSLQKMELLAKLLT